MTGRPSRSITQDAPGAVWVKSQASNPSGECAALARFPGGNVAIRNSCCPRGLWLLSGRAEMRAFIWGATAGEFDHLVEER